MKINNLLIKMGLVCFYVSFSYSFKAQSFENTKQKIRTLNRSVKHLKSKNVDIINNTKYIKDEASGEIVSKYLGQIDGTPMYLYPLSEDLAISNNTKPLNEGESLGYNLEGEGMTLILNDVGSPKTDHILFQDESGESRIGVNSEPIKFHPTHMASIICGNDDLGSTYKGMASKAKIELIENYGQEQYAESLVSNHSVIRTGGTYHYFFDGNTFNHPYHTEVTSSGNSGPFAYTLKNCSKNEITIGNIYDLVESDSPKDIVKVGTSSAGPTIDGRIKPDLVANGVSVLAASHASTSAVANGAGTSQSCAGVSGSLMLVQEFYHDQYDTYMKSATLKALAVHTARESGSNPGPDYFFGYGALNALEMVQVIEDDTLQETIHELDIDNNQIFTKDVYPNYKVPLIVTLAWTDPSGWQVIAPFDGNTIDTSLRALVNDLDIKIVSEGKVYKPYTLDRMNPCNPATYGNNTFDNLEMIEIPRPPNSDLPYTIEISHKGNLVNNHQFFSLIVTGTSQTQENVMKQSISIDEDDNRQWTVNKDIDGNININGKLKISGIITGKTEKRNISVLQDGELTLENAVLNNVDIYFYPNAHLILNGVTFLDNANFYLLDSVIIDEMNNAGLYVLSDSTFVYDYMDNVDISDLIIPNNALIDSPFPGIMAERICLYSDQMVDTVYNLCANEILLGYQSDSYNEGITINADVEINATAPLINCQELRVKSDKSFVYKIGDQEFSNPLIVPELEFAPVVHKYYNGMKYLTNDCEYDPISIYVD